MFQTADIDVSGLKFYSLGIVVKEDLESGNNDILVSPIETLNTQESSNIIKYKKEYKNFHPDEEGNITESEIEVKNYINATWLPLGQSNRSSAPDVVRNETVIIYKYKNVNKFYWTTTFFEPEIRRLEDVTYHYSNNREELEGGKENAYTIRVNTKEKYIEIKTVDNDGEKTKYEVKIDTKEGVLYAKDSEGNKIEMTSEGVITLKANQEINLDAPVVNISGNVNISAGLVADIISGNAVHSDNVYTIKAKPKQGGTIGLDELPSIDEGNNVPGSNDDGKSVSGGSDSETSDLESISLEDIVVGPGFYTTKDGRPISKEQYEAAKAAAGLTPSGQPKLDLDDIIVGPGFLLTRDGRYVSREEYDAAKAAAGITSSGKPVLDVNDVIVGPGFLTTRDGRYVSREEYDAAKAAASSSSASTTTNSTSQALNINDIIVGPGFYTDKNGGYVSPDQYRAAKAAAKTNTAIDNATKEFKK